jgi:hypothetical protein
MRNDRFNHRSLIEAETSGQVTGTGVEQSGGEEVGYAGSELTVEVPSVDSTSGQVTGSSDEVAVGLLLSADELGNEFRL